MASSCSSTAPVEDGGANYEEPSTDAGARPDAARDASGSRDAARDARTSVKADGAATDPMQCGTVELTTQRVVPRVWLFIDGSGSMSGALGLAGPARFTVLRDALMASGSGLVAKLQSSVAFGLMVYDGGNSPPGVYVPGVCPRVVVVEPALDNYAALDAAYPRQPLGASTPTHYALLDLQNRIQSAMTQEPSYVLMATDGKPNLCDFHDGVPASAATENEAVVTVSQLAAAGTKTFALSLAGNDPELRAHLDAVATAGQTGAGVFSPSDQGSLVQALTQILGGTQSCDLKVDGEIVAGKECSGDVTLNGRAVGCNDADGYRIKDDRKTLELLGAACEELRSEPSSHLEAAFACDDVVFL